MGKKPQKIVQQDRKLIKKINESAAKVFLSGLIGTMFIACWGVALGLLQFVSPIQYPTWIIVCWSLADVFISGFIVVHMLFYGLWISTRSWKNAKRMMKYMFRAGVYVLITAWILLANRYFAWVSTCALGTLCFMAIVDFQIWNNKREDHFLSKVELRKMLRFSPYFTLATRARNWHRHRI